VEPDVEPTKVEGDREGTANERPVEGEEEEEAKSKREEERKHEPAAASGGGSSGGTHQEKRQNASPLDEEEVAKRRSYCSPVGIGSDHGDQNFLVVLMWRRAR
jgi:hypothetical protein